MNLSHAAALALVGWYLMVPPSRTPEEVETFLKGWKASPKAVQEDKDIKDLAKSILTWNIEAPLSRWMIWESFDTAASCEKKRDQMNPYTDEPHPAREASNEQYAQCIATDDPRLKEK